MGKQIWEFNRSTKKTEYSQHGSPYSFYRLKFYSYVLTMSRLNCPPGQNSPFPLF